ncbi:hypothetical protein Pcac1_g5648 [Phytophthora cactorum]|nr:hypothetical protein Pcac1_g5648 [Phytophthora cactorum]
MVGAADSGWEGPWGGVEAAVVAGVDCGDGVVVVAGVGLGGLGGFGW